MIWKEKYKKVKRSIIKKLISNNDFKIITKGKKIAIEGINYGDVNLNKIFQFSIKMWKKSIITAKYTVISDIHGIIYL